MVGLRCEHGGFWQRVMPWRFYDFYGVLMEAGHFQLDKKSEITTAAGSFGIYGMLLLPLANNTPFWKSFYDFYV